MKRLGYLLVPLLLLGILFAAWGPNPTYSFMRDTEVSAGNTFAAGTWGPPPPPANICDVCPCWGPTGACRWAVFVHGEHLSSATAATLTLGAETVPAVKVWPICDDTVYCVFDLRGAPVGTYDIAIQTAKYGSAVLEKGFTVKGCPLLTATLTADIGLLLVNVEIKGQLPAPVVSIRLVRRGNLLTGLIDAVLGLLCKGSFLRAAIPAGTYDVIVTLQDQSNLLLESAVSIK